MYCISNYLCVKVNVIHIALINNLRMKSSAVEIILFPSDTSGRCDHHVLAFSLKCCFDELGEKSLTGTSLKIHIVSIHTYINLCACIYATKYNTHQSVLECVTRLWKSIIEKNSHFLKTCTLNKCFKCTFYEWLKRSTILGMMCSAFFFYMLHYYCSASFRVLY